MYKNKDCSPSSFSKRFFSDRRNVAVNAIFYTFLWGCAFPLVKICLQSFGVASTNILAICLIAGIRFACSGAVTLIGCSIFSPKSLKLSGKQLLAATGYGVAATSLQYAFTYIGLSRIDGSKGAVFDQLWVFVIVIIGGLFFKDERLTLTKIIGCILGFAGVLAVSTDGISLTFSLRGEGLMLMAAACQTFASIYAKKCTSTIPAPVLTGFGQLIGGILLIVGALISGGRLETVSSSAILSLVALTLISAIAYTLSLLPLKYRPVSEVSSYHLLITVFGVVMSAALLDENIFRINYAISLLLVSFGILLINRQ